MWIIYSFVQKVYSEIQVDIQHKTVYLDHMILACVENHLA